MTRYYVNIINWSSKDLPFKPKYPKDIIGLFTAEEPKYIGGRDYIMKYLNIRVIGYHISPGLMYTPELKEGDDQRCDIRLEWTHVCDMWTKFIDAENDDEAFEKFVNCEWHT